VPRKIIVFHESGSNSMLSEIPADNEVQLQELVKTHPELIPIEDFNMTGPLMVIGRETTLPSGGIDLVGLARSGELLLVEFKTGPQNPDFRQVLAQLLDYGSDLWRLSYEELESTVASRYFAGPHCQDERVRNETSLLKAARITWPDLSDEEASLLQERLSTQLATGGFHYLVAAQRFTPTLERTLEYLNAQMPQARFYAIEIVKFAANALSAYEARAVLRPSLRTTGPRPPSSQTDEDTFLNSIGDETYRDALHQLFEACRGLDLRFDWGSLGSSIRLPTADQAEPLTIAWIFPPGRAGWMGLTDLSLGVDTSSSARHPSVAPALEQYRARTAALPGAVAANPGTVRAYHLPPNAVVGSRPQITEILADLVQQTRAQA
jgi:hypothetical protein